jgi:hypothetical protein
MTDKKSLQDIANVKPGNSTKSTTVVKYKITITEVSEEIWLKPQYTVIGQELLETKLDGTELANPVAINVHGYAWNTNTTELTNVVYEQTVGSIDISKVVLAVNPL